MAAVPTRMAGWTAAGAGAPAARPSRNPNPMAARDPRNPHGGMNFAEAGYATGFGGYPPGARRVAGSSGYPDGGRGRMQYAGAITPISDESRSVPRPPPNMPMRSGSIRADVTRYNEERGAARNLQRQNDDPRQPEGSPYRN
jgi:hypothetical protein